MGNVILPGWRFLVARRPKFRGRRRITLKFFRFQSAMRKRYPISRITLPYIGTMMENDITQHGRRMNY
jgi:hypothetical protein